MASSDPSPNEPDADRPVMLGICAFCHKFRVPILILYAAVVLGISINALHRAVTEGRSSEFSGFREIVQESVVAGHDHLKTIQHIRAYPPFFAIAFAPFGLPPSTVGAAGFVIANILFLVLSTWLGARACFGGNAPPGAALLLFPLPAMFTLTVIARCETDLLVLFPLAGALALMVRKSRRRDVLAGVLLAFPAAMKLTPGLFGLFLLIQRRWAAFISMAVAGVVFFFGFGLAIWGFSGTIERHRTWYEKVLKPYTKEGPVAFITRPYRKINQSPTAALFRYLNKEHGGRLDADGKTKINVLDLPADRTRKIATALKVSILLVLITGWWLGARRMRSTKDPVEIKLIKESATIASKSFLEMARGIKAGDRERDLALQLENLIRKNGAESIPFPFIVASGTRGALPHGVATSKKIRRGELVTMDFGAVYRGYCSDETCTIIMGRPTARQNRVYQVVKEAHDKAIRRTKPGIKTSAIDSIARGVIEREGLGKYFVHGTGHGVGLSVHEEPRITQQQKYIVEEGMVFTIEPGVYIPRWGGVRIEDMVVVTRQGGEPLSCVPKELMRI